MVLGFIVFWPIGLAVLGWKFWQKKSGYPGDIVSFGREKWANWTHGSGGWGFAANNWPASGFGMGSTGNRAFDEWRAAELGDEKNEEACRRRARIREIHGKSPPRRDREEFERFMDAHRKPGSPVGQ